MPKQYIVKSGSLYLNNHYYREKATTPKIDEAYVFSTFELELALRTLFKNKDIQVIEYPFEKLTALSFDILLLM